MAKPYSMDLRERVFAAVRGGMSRRAAAAHFGVGVSTAIKWLERADRTGSVAPGQMGGHRPRRIVGAHRDWLVRRCQAGDFTLRGLVAELSARGLTVDYRTMWKFVHDEKLSFKKNSARPRAGSSRRRTAPHAMAQASGTGRSSAPGLHR